MDSRLNDLDPDANIFNEHDYTSNYYTISEFNTEFEDLSEGNYFLLNANIRSFKTNGEHFKTFLASFKLSPSFVIFSETWNTRNNLELCNLETYRGFHTHRSNMQSGGISVFTKNELVAKKIDSMSICNDLIETCTVQVDLDEGYMIIIGIYRPHSGTILEFTEQLDGMCDLPIVQNSKFVILAGDFNINILNSSSLPVSNFMSTMQSKYFFPTINKATRFESSTCLDHIWMNSTIHVNSGVIYYDQTDHCPTFMNFTPPNSVKVNEYISYSFRPYSESNKEKLIEQLTNIEENWLDILPSNNVDNMLKKFSSFLDELYCQCFPKKTKQLTYKRLNNPWLTSHLFKKIKLKSEY